MSAAICPVCSQSVQTHQGGYFYVHGASRPVTQEDAKHGWPSWIIDKDGSRPVGTVFVECCASRTMAPGAS